MSGKVAAVLPVNVAKVIAPLVFVTRASKEVATLLQNTRGVAEQPVKMVACADVPVAKYKVLAINKNIFIF